MSNIKRIPYSLNVTCNKGRLNDLIPSFNFLVILNEYVFGFTEVGGIDRHINLNDVKEGGNPYRVFARSNDCDFERITLKRGMLIRKGSLVSSSVQTAFAQAARIGVNMVRKAALVAAAASDPIVTLENGPAYGFIQVFDRKYQNDLATFSFFSYGAEEWRISDLSASSSDPIYEDIILVCTDLKRMSNSVSQSGFWNVIGEETKSEIYEMKNDIGTSEEDLKKIEDKKKENREKLFEEETEEEREQRKKEEIDEQEKKMKERIEEFKKQKEEIKKRRNKKELKNQLDEINKQKEKNRKDSFNEKTEEERKKMEQEESKKLDEINKQKEKNREDLFKEESEQEKEDRKKQEKESVEKNIEKRKKSTKELKEKSQKNDNS